jgi:hypothetical protein
MTTIHDPRPDRALSIRDFCKVEAMSVSSFYKMRKLGVGPREEQVPGTTIIRITPEARRDWHAMLAARQATQAAKLESERRDAHSKTAARAAARSPNHISKRARAKRAG